MPDETTQFILGDTAADALSNGRRGLFGRKRKGKKVRPRLTHCENCEAPLTGEYCANCGQHAIDYRRSLLRVLVDAADSFLNWDTKFLKSIGILIARPWRLTNDFNAGRRARYVHPLRLYLLASIAFFLMAKLVNFTGFSDNRTVQLNAEDRVEIDTALSKLSAPDSPLSPEQRAKIEAARARWSSPDSGIAQQRAKFDRAMLRLPRFAEKTEWKPKDLEKLDTTLATLEKLDREVEGPPIPPADSVGDNPAPAALPTPPPGPQISFSPVIQFDRGDSEPKDAFGRWIESRVKEKVGEDGTKATLFLDTLRSNVPTMMLFCVPLFAFVLKVLYFRQRRYYIEHLVYALHIHTFGYVAVVVITLLGMGAERLSPALQQVLIVILPFIAIAQVFVSIRRVYGQGWFMTTFKFLLGGLVYLCVLALGVGVTAFITLVLP